MRSRRASRNTKSLGVRALRARPKNKSRSDLTNWRGPGHTSAPAVRRPVIDDPKDSTGLTVRRLGHDLSHQPVERDNPRRGLTTAKQLETVDIQGGQISPSSAPFILMLDLHGRSRLGRQRGEDEVIVAQGLSVPDSFIQIQDAPGFAGELGIARENPASVRWRTSFASDFATWTSTRRWSSRRPTSIGSMLYV